MARDGAALSSLLGHDLRLEFHFRGGFFEDADLSVAQHGRNNDLSVATGVDNLRQAVAGRLKTRKGELAALGHPDYGSRHHELIGQPNVERTRNLIKLYVLQALAREPRIEKVLSARVRADHQPPRDTVSIELSLKVIEVATPLNLVVPFSLEAGS